MSDREIEIASMFFVDEVPQAQIAAWFRVTQQSVSQTVKEIAAQYPALGSARRAAGTRPRMTPISNLATADRLLRML